MSNSSSQTVAQSVTVVVEFNDELETRREKDEFPSVKTQMVVFRPISDPARKQNPVQSRNPDVIQKSTHFHTVLLMLHAFVFPITKHVHVCPSVTIS